VSVVTFAQRSFYTKCSIFGGQLPGVSPGYMKTVYNFVERF
jgi:hypothetical protein